MKFETLAEWLAWLERLHPVSIDLGLERGAAVRDRMGISPPPYRVITVGGTNGKGSVVALLTALLAAAGHRVGTYTSPHLQRYNERVVIDGREADDGALCTAFEAVDRARGDTSLTYFLPKHPDRERLFVSQTTLLILVFSSLCLLAVLAARPLFLAVTSFDFVLPLVTYVFFFANLNWVEYYWLAKRRTDLVLYYSAARLFARVAVLLTVAYLTRDVMIIIWSMVCVEALRFVLVAFFAARAGLLNVLITDQDTMTSGAPFPASSVTLTVSGPVRALPVRPTWSSPSMDTMTVAITGCTLLSSPHAARTMAMRQHRMFLLVMVLMVCSEGFRRRVLGHTIPAHSVKRQAKTHPSPRADRPEGRFSVEGSDIENSVTHIGHPAVRQLHQWEQLDSPQRWSLEGVSDGMDGPSGDTQYGILSVRSQRPKQVQ
jgi:hypothetical protein